MLKSIILVMAMLSLIALSACSTAPSCNDSDAIETVLALAQEELTRKVGPERAKKAKMRLVSIRTTSTNEEARSCACAADLLLMMDGESTKLPIEYTSELTHTGNELYVTVTGL